MKNRKREWNKLRKYLYNLKWTSSHLILMTPDRRMCVEPKDGTNMAGMEKCFPMEREPWSYWDFCETYDSIYKEYCLKECSFDKNRVDIICQFYNNNLDKLVFTVPEKASPLIITTNSSNFCFAIAPKIDEDKNSQFEDINGYKEITGCKCPKLIEEFVKIGILK